MKKTSLIKFIKQEELANILVQIRNWKRHDTKNLDVVDVLICGEGYVRYEGCCEYVLKMLRERLGFVDE